jgi:glycosyltransferase involved in cell wall biosynthesis
MKKKILFVNESSSVLSGFGTYGKEILSRLYKSNKFEIAEFAIGASLEHVRANPVPWRVYANNVQESDGRYREFMQNRNNHFGEWRFNRVLLDYHADIVFDPRDPYNFTFEAISPLRKYYHWSIMPTCDSAPIREQWIEMFETADSVFAYTDWGGEIMRKQSHGTIKYIGSASPGVNLDVLKPVADKKAHRKAHGFNEDAIIIGTVMRNQMRKLYPDLFHALRLFLDKYPEISDNVYLYCHVAYPDTAGWDIPYWLKFFGVEDRVLFSYVCMQTRLPFASKFQDSKTYSPYSNAATGVLPTVSYGYTEEQMGDMYNLFDAYIQYATCEGAGMPQLEAAACGLPLMAVDYSGMADIVAKTKGFPLKVERMFFDHGTGAIRALPDDDYCADTFARFVNMTKEQRSIYSKNSRKAAEKYFDWDKTGDKLIQHFDSLVLENRQGRWDSPPELYRVPNKIPGSINTTKGFVNWLYMEVIREPHRINSVEALNLTKDLNLGFVTDGGRMQPVTPQEIFELFRAVAENKILCEKIRCGILKPPHTDYIEYANK